MPTTFECLTGPVAGIDTHTDTHTVAIISDTGRHIATDTFPATNLGYKAISEFIATSGVTTVGVEGTSSYGAGLTRYLLYPEVHNRRSPAPDPDSSTPGWKIRSR